MLVIKNNLGLQNKNHYVIGKGFVETGKIANDVQAVEDIKSL
jgi:hypothetical protein